MSQCAILTVNAPPHGGMHGLISMNLLAKLKAWCDLRRRGRYGSRACQAAGRHASDCGASSQNRGSTSGGHCGLPCDGNGMTLHYSGTTLAQSTNEILLTFLRGKPHCPGNVIVRKQESASCELRDDR
jgi:hypothetical protein